MNEALASHVARVQTQIMVSLAGRLAERRARRCDDDGRRCEFLLSPQQLLAAHEAGHGAVGVALGWCCHELSIVPERDVPVGRGRGYLAGFASVCPAALVEDVQRAGRRRKCIRLESDAQTVAQLALQLALLEPDYGWMAACRIIRRLRAETEALIEAHWNRVKYLANTLEWRKTMAQSEIESCLRGIQTKGTKK